MRKPTHTLVYDVANILFRVAAMQKSKNPYIREATPDELVGLCMHISLASIFKWYIKYKPDFVVFAFEGANLWRKEYTAAESTKQRLQYKANRVYDPGMAHYYQLVNSFRETMKAHTSICCLAIEGLEGDDVIAGYTQLYAEDDHKITIISGDKDFIQLTRLPNVQLVDPDTGKLRNQPGDKAYEADLDYWIFLKCVRGDMGDYVPSAFPRVRETKIRAAYEHDYERINFMNTTWVDEQQNVQKVGDLYEHNVILLDLFKQPPEIRELIEEGVKLQVEDLGNYSHFHFLRFLEEYKLQSVRENAMKFVELFTNNQRFRKGEKTVQKTQQITKSEPEVIMPKQSTLLYFS